jgi:ATP-dependent protease HslVU (ClpYQ) ATPase subunit
MDIQKIVVDVAFVDTNLGELVKSTDLSRYVL